MIWETRVASKREIVCGTFTLTTRMEVEGFGDW